MNQLDINLPMPQILPPITLEEQLAYEATYHIQNFNEGIMNVLPNINIPDKLEMPIIVHQEIIQEPIEQKQSQPVEENIYDNYVIKESIPLPTILPLTFDIKNSQNEQSIVYNSSNSSNSINIISNNEIIPQLELPKLELAEITEPFNGQSKAIHHIEPQNNKKQIQTDSINISLPKINHNIQLQLPPRADPFPHPQLQHQLHNPFPTSFQPRITTPAQSTLTFNKNANLPPAFYTAWKPPAEPIPTIKEVPIPIAFTIHPSKAVSTYVKSSSSYKK